jgi:hypothetical protein
MGKAAGQCDRTLATVVEISAACGIHCRVGRSHPVRRKPGFYWIFRCGTALAHLIGHETRAAIPRGAFGGLIMLMALGAASAAWDAVKSVGSQMSSAAQSTGFFGSGGDPFTMSGSGSSQPGSKKSSSSGSGALSPATMQAMLAAQGQLSSSTFNGSGLSSASLTPLDTSSLTPVSLGGSSSAASSYNATGMMLQRAQLMSAFA